MTCPQVCRVHNCIVIYLFLIIVVVRRSKQVAKNQLRHVHFFFVVHLNGNSFAIVPDTNSIELKKKTQWRNFAIIEKIFALLSQPHNLRQARIICITHRFSSGLISILRRFIDGSRCLLSAALTRISSKICQNKFGQLLFHKVVLSYFSFSLSL